MIITTITACSKRETLEDIVSNMYSTGSNTTNTVASTSNNGSNPPRGVFSWLSSNSSKNKDNVEAEISSKNVPKIIDNSIQEVVIEEEDSNPKQIIDNNVNVAPKTNFLKNLWAKIQTFKNKFAFNKYKAAFVEDTISNRNGLNVVVLRIPKSDELNIKVDKLSEKANSIDHDLKISNIDDSEIYSDFKINDKSLNKENVNISLSGNLETQQIYKDYVYNLKYRDVVTIKNKILDPIDNITELHKNLINQLLATNTTTPNVLYIIYRNLNGPYDNSSVSSQLFLSSYMSKIRSFAYSKNLNRVFIQEVKFNDLPVNQILLVLKPITNEQFSMLPKQSNLYNASKISSKEWVNFVTSINELAKQKQKTLYKQASGLGKN